MVLASAPCSAKMHFMNISGVKGIFFDMDGTLVDSEINTEKSVDLLLSEMGVAHEGLDYKQYYGITWQAIEKRIKDQFPATRDKELSGPLQHRFHELFKTADYIPGVREFIVAAKKSFRTAIATSSNRESVAYLVERMNIGEFIDDFIGAEDYNNSKPDPECYLLVAEKLGLAPENCLVFEDSIPGLQAARNAGMWAAAITLRSPDENRAREIAHLAARDYHELPSDFLAKIR